MFDDSGFGGDSMFDADHDGNLNAFERDNAECFLHDSDTYDQVMEEEDYSSNTNRTNAYYISIIKMQLKVIFVLVIIYFILDLIL